MLKFTPRKVTPIVVLLFLSVFTLQFFVTRVRLDPYTAEQHWLTGSVYWLQEKLLFWDRMDYDRRIRAKPPVSSDPRVAVVEINEPSLKALGQFPFTRSIYADFLRLLSQAGAKVAAFDVVFSEPERNQAVSELDNLFTVLRANKIGKPVLDYLATRKELLDSDGTLARALDGSIRVVWGYPFLSPVSGIQLMGEIESDQENYPIPALSKTQIDASSFDFKAIFYGFNPVLPLERLRQGKNVSFGSFNAATDGDSMIREAAMVYRHNDQVYPALAVSAVAAYTGKPFYLSTSSQGLVLAQDGGLTVPLENGGRVNVNYYGPAKTVPTYEFIDVLQGKVSQELKDKIVFLGVTAVGLKDLRGTPFSPNFPGVEVHATVASNILQGKYILRGLDFFFSGIIAILLGTVLASLTVYRFSAVVAVGGTALILVLLDQIGQYAFNAGFFIPTLFPGFSTGSMMFIGILQKYLSAESEKKFVREAFSRYVSGAVVDEIIKDPARLRLGGQKKELTVLFSDMVGFTKMSEHLPADQLTKVLNEYFTRMTKVILDQKGTLDKYIGDAVMCFWGAPLEVRDHARFACAAALGMQRELLKLNQEWQSTYCLDIGMRIGLNTGEMAVGNMGSEQVFNYTVLGDNVNLGSRIEGVNNLFGTKILVGHRTYELAKNHFLFRHVDTVAVKGRETPEEVYELISEMHDAEQYSEWLTAYQRAVDYYKSGNWSDAEDAFRLTETLNPTDRAPKVFLERITLLKQEAPEDWQGVWILKEK